MREVLTNATMVIISQYLSVSNQHNMHLNLTQCCMSIVPQQSWKKMRYHSVLGEGPVLIYRWPPFAVLTRPLLWAPRAPMLSSAYNGLPS